MLPELVALEKRLNLSPLLSEKAKVTRLTHVSFKNESYPIFAFTFGTSNPKAPVLFITGGVHGLERIGAQLALSLLTTTIDRLSWDKSLYDIFSNLKLVFVPLVNPVGYYHYKRSNGNDVDLMRNSPVSKINFFRQLILAAKIKVNRPSVPLNVISSKNEDLLIQNAHRLSPVFFRQTNLFT